MLAKFQTVVTASLLGKFSLLKFPYILSMLVLMMSSDLVVYAFKKTAYEFLILRFQVYF